MSHGIEYPQCKIRTDQAVNRYSGKEQVGQETDQRQPLLDQRQAPGKTLDLPERHQNPRPESGNNPRKKRGIEQISDIPIFTLQNTKRAVMRGEFIKI